LTPTGETINEPFVPILIVFIIAYTISSIFIGIFDASANTIL
jgi:hypothetical protein